MLKNALEQAKTEEHAKTEGQTEIKNQAEAETSRAAKIRILYPWKRAVLLIRS